MKEKGLSREEVNELVKLGKINYIKNSANKSVLEIISSNVFTYFNFIFLVLSILVIISGHFKNLMFLPVVIANMLIGIFQQVKSKKVLDKLSLLDVSIYTVIRDGKELDVKSTELVEGDIVKIQNGSQIPGDAVVIEGEASVNESLLTGEADDIEKKIGSELKSGSFLTSGNLLVKLTHVGKDSYVAKLTMEAKVIKEKKAEMVRDVEKIIRIVGIIIIPIGSALLYQSIVVNHTPYTEAVASMVGAVTGMIPEGLYLLVTIALALSAARLAKVKVLLHDMKSIESLARVDVLCVDKTGTITSSKMSLTDVVLAKNNDDLDNSKMLLTKYVNTIKDSNITMDALKKYCGKSSKFITLRIEEFNSKTKYSLIETKDSVYKLGAPEVVLSKSDLSANKDIITSFAAQGRRVLVFTDGNNKKARPLLFIALKNELRENAIETFDFLQEQGVEIKVISGDNPLTVSKVAEEAGIKNASKYIDTSNLTTRKEIEEAVENYTVFGRVKPEQKKDIILAIKKNKVKVAMTGDGVNDILAMKEADCSIAMGEGSEAARSVAQVVLMDSDFSHMKDIIYEGRRNINNITRSATLFLYKNLFSIFLALFSLIASFNYPLKPTQISIISFFNIGLPAFLLTFEVNIKKQKGKFLKNVLVNAIPASLTSFFAVIVMILFAQLFNIDYSEVATASIYLISVIGFNIFWLITRPMNKYHRLVCAICIGGIFLVSRSLGNFFDLKDISLKASALCLVFAFAEMSIIRDFAYLLDQLYKRFSGFFDKVEKSVLDS